MFTLNMEQKIRDEYQKLQKILPDKYEEIERCLITCTKSEQDLLRYLYGNMPISDVVNYPFSLYLSYAKHGVFLWETGMFSKKIPEDIFLQYVAFHRVNTEEVVPVRQFFYEQVKEIIVETTMEEAVKRINYWCASKASYRASDERTASPLTVYDSGYGRCGEESTFVVSVLRSAGIPARQIYAPRWSHCDDNHAWVEVWCDGTWKFLGGCEPEEILNRGWFTSASSRAMLLHTRFFGNLCNQEKKKEITGGSFVKELNQSQRYADVKKVQIEVQDSAGKLLKDALVQVQVLNYSQFCTIAECKTDKEGKCEIFLGQGSARFLCWQDGKTAEEIVNIKDTQKVVLQLQKTTVNERWENFIFYAPSDSEKNATILTKEQKVDGKQKLALAEKFRRGEKAKLNEQEIEKWKKVDAKEQLKQALWNALSQKDHFDFKSNILEEHLKEAAKYEGNYPKDVYEKYLLAPRIEYETLTAYRRSICNYFTEEQKYVFIKDPKEIWKFIESHVHAVKREYDSLITLPVFCLESGMGNDRSKAILFVAICRSLGIPARLNQINGTKEYYKEEQFCKVEDCEEETSTLKLYFSTGDRWDYEENFAIMYRKCGKDQKLLLENVFDGMELKVIPGEYEVVTQNRLPNGNIYGRSIKVLLRKNENTTLQLEKYPARVKDMLEKIPLPSFKMKNLDGIEILFPQVNRKKKQIFLWLEEGKEPTEHILNEMVDKKQEFENEEIQISFVLNNRKAFSDQNIKRALEHISGIEKYISDVEEDCAILGRRMYVDPERLPLGIIIDQSGYGVYAASGYNVGTADMFLRVLKEIDE